MNDWTEFLLAHPHWNVEYESTMRGMTLRVTVPVQGQAKVHMEAVLSNRALMPELLREMELRLADVIAGKVLEMGRLTSFQVEDTRERFNATRFGDVSERTMVEPILPELRNLFPYPESDDEASDFAVVNISPPSGQRNLRQQADDIVRLVKDGAMSAGTAAKMLQRIEGQRAFNRTQSDDQSAKSAKSEQPRRPFLRPRKPMIPIEGTYGTNTITRRQFDSLNADQKMAFVKQRGNVVDELDDLISDTSPGFTVAMARAAAEEALKRARDSANRTRPNWSGVGGGSLLGDLRVGPGVAIPLQGRSSPVEVKEIRIVEAVKPGRRRIRLEPKK